MTKEPRIFVRSTPAIELQIDKVRRLSGLTKSAILRMAVDVGLPVVLKRFIPRS